MRRITTIGVTLIAVLAMGALFASAAFALPELLPGGKFTGKSVGTSKPTLETLSGTKIECNKAEGSGEDTSDTLGKFTIDFKECKTPNFFNASCNTKGDSSGIILSTGEYHYVYDVEKTGVAVLFLPNETTIECSSFLKTIVKSESANGGLVCLIKEPTVKSTKHIFKCEGASGDQTQKTYFNDSKASVKAQLICSLNGGSFESCDEVAEAENIYKEANAFEEV
jgi:hypothetical protein